MTNYHKFFASLAMATALMMPAALTVHTASARQEGGEGAAHRYYDEDRKDYHNWDADEDRAWKKYEKEQRKKEHDFSKADKKEQQEYWHWRHDHPDDHDADHDKH